MCKYRTAIKYQLMNCGVATVFKRNVIANRRQRQGCLCYTVGCLQKCSIQHSNKTRHILVCMPLNKGLGDIFTHAPDAVLGTFK